MNIEEMQKICERAITYGPSVKEMNKANDDFEMTFNPETVMKLLTSYKILRDGLDENCECTRSDHPFKCFACKALAKADEILK